MGDPCSKIYVLLSGIQQKTPPRKNDQSGNETTGLQPGVQDYGCFTGQLARVDPTDSNCWLLQLRLQDEIAVRTHQNL